MVEFSQLTCMFPKNPRNSAVCGAIPIAYFDANEKELRAVMRAKGYTRAIYRGERVSNRVGLNGGPRWGRASNTRRCDATSVLFYYGV